MRRGVEEGFFLEPRNKKRRQIFLYCDFVAHGLLDVVRGCRYTLQFVEHLYGHITIFLIGGT